MIQQLDFQVKLLYCGLKCRWEEVARMDVQVIWDHEPDGNVEHVAENDLTPDEVDDVLLDDAIPTAYSHSSGRPCKFGYTSTGKHIIVIWEEENEDPRVIIPVTAYEVPEQF
jgi:hypothetical protein